MFASRASRPSPPSPLPPLPSPPPPPPSPSQPASTPSSTSTASTASNASASSAPPASSLSRLRRTVSSHPRMRPPWRRAAPGARSPHEPSDSVQSDSVQSGVSSSHSFPPKAARHPHLRRLHNLFHHPSDARDHENLRGMKRRVIKLRRQPDHAPVRLTVGFRSRTGWEPIRVAKENQDCLVALVPCGPHSQFPLLGVLDGHGRNGHHCSLFIAQRVEAYLSRALASNSQDPQCIAHALHRAMLYAEHKLEHLTHIIDYSLSGSTATFVLIHGATLYCANVGDSRTVVGRLTNAHSSQPPLYPQLPPNNTRKKPYARPEYIPVPISIDQKPSRPDEMQRLLAAGARVDAWEGMNVGEMRVWRPDTRTPGLAVSRAFGDLEVKQFGVNSVPEIFQLDLHADDQILVLGSDGVFEFLSNEEIINLLGRYRRSGAAQEAAEKLVKLATEKWMDDDSIIDDISCIVVFLDVVASKVSTPGEAHQLQVTCSMSNAVHSSKKSISSGNSTTDCVKDCVLHSGLDGITSSSNGSPERANANLSDVSPSATGPPEQTELPILVSNGGIESEVDDYDQALQMV